MPQCRNAFAHARFRAPNHGNGRLPCLGCHAFTKNLRVQPGIPEPARTAVQQWLAPLRCKMQPFLLLCGFAGFQSSFWLAESKNSKLAPLLLQVLVFW